jgi:acyl-CoA thioester hydrolase
MRLPIPEEKKFLYQMTLAMRWGDMDALGHINNVSYFRFMESIRMDWLHSLGLDEKNSGASPVILNTFCNFHQQLVYPGELCLRLFAGQAARATFESWTTIERVDQPGKIYASGGATVVWVDWNTQRAADLPIWVREIVSQ